MQKIKTGSAYIWNLFLDGADFVADKINTYPKTTLVLIVLYVMVRQ